jgi:hypothetical protein
MLHTGRPPLFLRVTDRIGVTAEFGEFGYSLGCNWPIAGVRPQAAFGQKQSFRPGIANRAMGPEQVSRSRSLLERMKG